ncbi:hypothetical protein D3C71_2036520 [compost metagenome]
MRRAERLLHAAREHFHLHAVGHIDALRQHLHAGGTHLLGRGLERLALHIDQHQVHAQARANARALQAKARAGTGQHRGLALKVIDHG